MSDKSQERLFGVDYDAEDKPRWHWLESTRELQTKFFGVEYEKLTGLDMATYLMGQALSAHCEITEFLDEVNWKPWALDQRGEVPDRTAAIGELVDLGHFLANLLCALGVTDEEWEQLYTAKQQRNRARQESGSYTRQQYKCPDCNRELDRPNAIAWGNHINRFFCTTCHAKVDIKYRCGHCGLIEPKHTILDDLAHCDNCGSQIFIPKLN